MCLLMITSWHRHVTSATCATCAHRRALTPPPRCLLQGVLQPGRWKALLANTICEATYYAIKL